MKVQWTDCDVKAMCLYGNSRADGYYLFSLRVRDILFHLLGNWLILEKIN
jgi:hypothetical protein